MTQNHPPIADSQQRETALDPTQSFIVQAPAGSGKTELLTQRFLMLLAHATHVPEEIIAITFTRKAAAEMRTRIISALNSGTSTAALAARTRDKQENWALADNANRLRIMTIDALCSHLVQQLPLRAKIAAKFSISDDQRLLYKQAVQNLLLMHTDNINCTNALSELLGHLDNDISRVEDLCVDILSNRDQWLPHVFGFDAIDYLQQALINIVTEQLQKCDKAIPIYYRSECLALLKFAAAHTKNADLQLFYDLSQLPTPEIKNIQQWQAIAQFFLNKDGQWRKKFTVTEGFPAVSSTKNKTEKQLFADYKTRLQMLLENFEQEEYLRECFADLCHAPPVFYSEDQQKLIKSLVTLLPLLVAELQLIFAKNHQVDFTEIALRAAQALSDSGDNGDSDDPTELALSLDYQIQHLLIDEFQDTSITQLRLIEKLISGWMPGDGRTLFLVGDPMQSIYRFRKAEVGLFLQVQQQGIGNIVPMSLRLCSNFRATPQLIHWVNKSFTRIFPSHADQAVGAIAYSPSQALPKTSLQDAINYHYIDNMDIADNKPNTEAENIIKILQKTWQRDPNANIAILVRARQQLRDILPLLEKEKIGYRAVEMATLQDNTLIQDLFSLTRALLHPADRIAWLAILRAPWCSLNLNDLYILMAHDHQSTIWDLLNQLDENLLSPEGKLCYQHIMPVLTWMMAERGRLSLRAWVEQTWLKLNGPVYLSNPLELQNAAIYFDLLNTKSLDINITQIEKQLTQLALPPNPDPAIRLDIMTIHKAKGLEFDVVILPGLAKVTRADQLRLFLWAERMNAHGKADLLMAPIKSASTKHDAIYWYLKNEEDKRNRYELQRLLYVAVTRAKQALHLLLPIDKKIPEKNTLLAQLWPVVGEDISQKDQNFATIA